MPASSSRPMNASSGSSHGCSSSWSACMPPPSTIVASCPSGRASGVTGTDHSVSSCPAARTASAKTPVPTDGPCVTASTRIARP